MNCRFGRGLCGTPALPGKRFCAPHQKVLDGVRVSIDEERSRRSPSVRRGGRGRRRKFDFEGLLDDEPEEAEG